MILRPNEETEIITENKTRYNMNKLIRLTESDLHRIVKESVQRILKETRLDYNLDNFSCVPTIHSLVNVVLKVLIRYIVITTHNHSSEMTPKALN